MTRLAPAAVLVAAWMSVAPVAGDDAVEVEESSASVTDALQGKEGVRIQTMCTHCNSANIQVGGLNKELVPLSRDGFPVFGGLATSFVLSMLPADEIAEAQVVRGPGSVRDPSPAAGGAIRLEGAAPEDLPRLDLAATAGSFGRRAGDARAAGRLATWLQGSLVVGRETVDRVDADSDGWTDVAGVERTIAEGRLRAQAGRSHSLDLAGSWIDETNPEGRGAFDVLGYLAGPSPGSPQWTREDASLERREARAGWRWDLRDGRRLEARVLNAARDQRVRSQLTRIDYLPGAQDLFERLRIDEQDWWGTVRFAQPVGSEGMLEGGVESSYQRVHAESLNAFDLISGSPPVVETAVDYVKLRSVFSEYRTALGPKWDLQLGARLDDADQFGRRGSPRATLRFFPAAGWTLRLLAGRTFRPPEPIFTEVCCGQRYQRNTSVEAERGTTVGFEGIYQPSPRLRVSLYAARSDFDDHIVRLVAWSAVYTQTYALANVPRARAETLEIAARLSPVESLTLDASIGWLSFRNRDRGRVGVVVSPPFGGLETVQVAIDRIPYQPARTASFAASWTLPRRVAITGQASYTGSMMIQQFAAEASTASNLLLDDMRPTPGFWIASISAEVPVTRRLGLALGVDNLTDYVQEDLGDPTRDYNWGPLTGRSYRIGARFRLDR